MFTKTQIQNVAVYASDYHTQEGVRKDYRAAYAAAVSLLDEIDAAIAAYTVPVCTAELIS